MSMMCEFFEQEVISRSIDGAEEKKLFSPEQLAEVIEEIDLWFQDQKDRFPYRGIYVPIHRDEPVPIEHDGIFLPEPIRLLVGSMIADASEDGVNTNKSTAKILLEQTGLSHTDPNDIDWHVDSSKVLFDKELNRISYENNRGPDKYMSFVNRPGVLLIEGILDAGLSYEDAMELASHYRLDAEAGCTRVDEGYPSPRIVQLDPRKIWKVAAGSLMHAPAPHDEGLLVTVSMVD